MCIATVLLCTDRHKQRNSRNFRPGIACMEVTSIVRMEVASVVCMEVASVVCMEVTSIVCMEVASVVHR